MSDFKQLSRSVKGLTVLVTGAASGMGRATALVFASRRRQRRRHRYQRRRPRRPSPSEIAASGGTAKAWTLDVADRDDITDVVNDVAAHFGGLDIVINNAGISVRVAIDDDGYDEAWAKGLAVMLTAHPAHHPRRAAAICANRNRRGSSTSPPPRRSALPHCTAPTPRPRPAWSA